MTELAQKSREIDKNFSQTMENLRRKLQDRQAELKNQQEAAKRASAQGDRSENAEWQIANDNVARLVMEISSLEGTLDIYERYKASYSPSGKVMLGSTVKLLDRQRGVTLFVKIFPPGLGNAKIGAIASTTPVGSAILGKVSGAEVVVKAPIGEIPYYIEEVL